MTYKTIRRLLSSIFLLTICLFAFPLGALASEAGGVVNYGIYRIKNSYTGKYLTVHNGLDVAGTNIYQSTYDTYSAAQKFKFVYDSARDAYSLYPLFSTNKVVGTITTTTGANISLRNYSTDNNNQYWKVGRVGGSIVQLYPASAETQYAISTYGSESGSASGTSSTSPGNVYLSLRSSSFSQQWELIPADPVQEIPNGIYHIRSGYSDKYMQAAASASSIVVQKGFSGERAQQWQITYRGNGCYTFHPAGNTSLALEVLDGGDYNGASLQINTYQSGYLTQLFRIIPCGNGRYRINTRRSIEHVLDVTGPSKEDNARIQLWSYGNGNSQQQWYLEGLGGAYWSTPSARGAFQLGDALTTSFRVSATASYTIETAQPNAPHGVKRDTKLYLYNSSTGSLVAQNDDISSSNHYSRIQTSLSPGTYTVRLVEYPSTVKNLASYLTVYKAGELHFASATYSNLTFDYIKIGNASAVYNCLSYALGYTNYWENPKGSLSITTDFFESKGYRKVSSPTNNCVVAYADSSGYVGHFARVENGVVRAKLGNGELVQHSKIDAYYEQSVYGKPIAYYVKN